MMIKLFHLKYLGYNNKNSKLVVIIITSAYLGVTLSSSCLKVSQINYEDLKEAQEPLTLGLGFGL